MKKIDIKLYEYIRNNSKDMPHNDLYYLLLDWADQHREIHNELAGYYSAYRISYIDSNGESHDCTFKGSEFENPYKEARMCCHDAIKEGAEVNDRIEYAVSRGDFHLEFSESFDLRFEEHRKEVKRKLEELGYKVEYRRFMVGDRDYQMWLNKYFISW